VSFSPPKLYLQENNDIFIEQPWRSKMSRSIVYDGNLDQLESDSAALVQRLADAGHPSRWKPGDRVVDLAYLPPGTVIANFDVIKRYPGGSGFAAAVFKRFGPRLPQSKHAGSIVLLDQRIRGKFKARTLFNHGPDNHEPDNAYNYVVVKV
jgi:hypothetical protein